MKKTLLRLSGIVFALSLAAGCSGCGQTEEGVCSETGTLETIAETSENETPEATTESETETDAETGMAPDAVQKEDLTMEQLISYSEREKLLTEELLIWNDLQDAGLTSESYQQYYYDFSYEGNEYRLELRCDTDNTLLFARLVDMQTMLNIDIRTGNIEHLIDNTVAMEDYISCTLPDGGSFGEYDVYKGHFGGTALTMADEPCGSILILDGSRVNPVISDGKIINISEYDNNVYHTESEEISSSSVPAILTIMEVEEDTNTTEYYSIYFAKESCYYCYNIRLRTDVFTMEEALAVANSVQFTEQAFY